MSHQPAPPFQLAPPPAWLLDLIRQLVDELPRGEGTYPSSAEVKGRLTAALRRWHQDRSDRVPMAAPTAGPTAGPSMTSALQVTFEFVGGPHDGRILTGRLGEGGDAERHFLVTQHGTVGFLFKVASDYAVETLARETLSVNKRPGFQQHYYAVVERVDTEGETHVRAEYVPEATQVRGDA